MAVTGVGEARIATSEDGKESLLLQRGLRDGSDVHVGCRDREVYGRIYEGCSGDKNDQGVSMRVAKVMKRMTQRAL